MILEGQVSEADRGAVVLASYPTTCRSGVTRPTDVSHASGYRQEAISSHHAASCCGPRRRSGSSAL